MTRPDIITHLKSAAGRILYLLLHKAYIPTEYIILENDNLVYIPIPKVACTSIKECLYGKVISVPEQYKDYMEIHSLLAKRASYDLRENQRKLFIFAFVRNPFDRLVSCYLDKVKRTIQHNGRYYFDTWYNRFLLRTITGFRLTPSTSFSDFVRFVSMVPDFLADGHFRSQHAFIFGNRHVKPHFIGKFEQLEHDWEIISKRYQLPSLPHRNPTESRDLSQWFHSKELIDKVYSRYKRDIDSWYRAEYLELLKRIS